MAKYDVTFPAVILRKSNYWGKKKTVGAKLNILSVWDCAALVILGKRANRQKRRQGLLCRP